MAIVTLLSTCTISKPLEENGQEYVPEIKYFGQFGMSGNLEKAARLAPQSSHFICSQMEPFEACVRPRSAGVAELLRETCLTRWFR